MKHLLLFGSACALVAGQAIVSGNKVSASGEALAPDNQEFYAKRVKAILQNNCVICHDEAAPGGLNLDSYALIRKGGKDGPVIVPGDPEASLLIKAVRRTGELK